jgi:hypothetical protein
MVDECLEVRGRDGRGDGHADRTAEVLRGIEQTRRDARVACRKPTAFDPATLLSRNSGSGRSGASTLVSMTKNTASNAAPAESMATV